MSRPVVRVLLAALVAVVVAAPTAQGQEPGPVETGDGTRTLTVSKADGLDPAGERIVVSGSGYDEDKGIYVVFCLAPPSPDQAPTPCGGGVDTSGESGGSAWVSSDPPPYGVDLAVPYGPGGTFEVELLVAPEIAEGVDCREQPCVVGTRNDHTRSADRSQDLFVPITFADGAPPAAATPAPTPTAAPPASAAPTPEPSAAGSAAAPTPAAVAGAAATETASGHGDALATSSAAAVALPLSLAAIAAVGGAVMVALRRRSGGGG
ncbi:MAG TPA: hypothetical protein VIK95_11420 [Egibacteraceae bacterium]